MFLIPFDVCHRTFFPLHCSCWRFSPPLALTHQHQQSVSVLLHCSDSNEVVKLLQKTRADAVRNKFMSCIQIFTDMLTSGYFAGTFSEIIPSFPQSFDAASLAAKTHSAGNHSILNCDSNPRKIMQDMLCKTKTLVCNPTPRISKSPFVCW